MMLKNRKRIAVIFNFRKGWMGGIIYIINLVNALNFLEDEDKPEITVFYNPDLSEFIKDFEYPYVQFKEWNFPVLWKGYLLSFLTGKNVFVEKIIADFKPAGIYPLNDWPISGKRMLAQNTRVVAWIPDLQHKFYPHFFTRLRVFMRELRIKLLLHNATDLAVSSKDVGNHFRKFYQIRPELNIHELRFVSIIKNFSFHSLTDLRAKYAIKHPYFIVSNQFTNHKNHKVLLRALIHLKSVGTSVNFVFTGKMDFKGNEKYIAEIRSIIKENGLDEEINMLGIISRQDQLSLMKHARAVVQPSLFEGWSTVIEDAKSLQVPVIASDLPVNIEQLGETGFYFSPNNEIQLATLLGTFNESHSGDRYDKYEERVKKFAKDFMAIFSAGNSPSHA